MGLTTTIWTRVIHVRISQFRGVAGKCPGAKGVTECDYTIHARGMLQIIREHMVAPGTQFTPTKLRTEKDSLSPDLKYQRRVYRGAQMWDQKTKAPKKESHKNVRNNIIN